MTTPTSGSAAARGSLGVAANPPLSEAPGLAVPPGRGSGASLSPGSHCARCQAQDDAEDDVISSMVPEIGQRRIREEAARDRRFRLAGVTESELRLLDGNR